jgi:hypothetical protein
MIRRNSKPQSDIFHAYFATIPPHHICFVIGLLMCNSTLFAHNSRLSTFSRAR